MNIVYARTALINTNGLEEMSWSNIHTYTMICIHKRCSALQKSMSFPRVVHLKPMEGEGTAFKEYLGFAEGI